MNRIGHLCRIGEIMVLQEKNYIAKQRKKHFILGLCLTLVVLGIFAFGLIMTKTRANLFTVCACVTAIGASLFITRWISFSRYKDGEEAIALLLEALPQADQIYHSAIIPYAKGTAYFEHIVVIGTKIYLIAYTKKQIEQHGKAVQEVLEMKGILRKNLSFIVIENVEQMKKYIPKMEQAEKSTCEYGSKISEILM